VQNLRIQIFWDVTPYHYVSFLRLFETKPLKKNPQTQHHIPEDLNLNSPYVETSVSNSMTFALSGV